MRRNYPNYSTPLRTARGVTLIELMVGLGIAVILATLAAPSFVRQINSSRIASAASEMQSSLSMARSQAVQTGKPVSLCRVDAAGSCATAAGAGWEQGWIVFHDADGNGIHDAGDTITTRVATLPAQIKVTGNANVANKVTFRPSGTAVAGTIAICSTSGALKDTDRALKLVVISGGRVVQERSKKSVGDTCPALGTDD